MAKKNKLKYDDDQSDEEPNFDDPEDFVDDIADEELLVELYRSKPKESDGYGTVIVVDGVPCVEQERLEKLKKVIRRFFEESGTILNEFYPADKNGKTKGYIFLEYKDKASAEAAVKKGTNYKLDKQHTFICNLVTDFEKYKNIPDNFTPPKPQPYKDFGNPYYYLMEENGQDQFLVISDCNKPDPTSGSGNKPDPNSGLNSVNLFVYINSLPEPQEHLIREKASESYVKWSPKGTYLATFHVKGVILWGGEEFQQVQRFSQLAAQFIDFSPCENYITTFSPKRDQWNNEEHAIIIFDIKTGQKKRGFHADKGSFWPVFKWSHDDKYFGRVSDDLLSVYETPSFGLLDKKSIRATGVKDFSWSPSDNVIAYWIAENKDVPAKVTLISLPSKEEIRAKNLFNVAACEMFWQKCGDYLCVKVERYVKRYMKDNVNRYAGTYFNLEIFHMREKGIPVDSVEIKEQIQAFSWEPRNNKFAIISGESSSGAVTFFQVREGQQPVELKKFDKRPWNNIFWSPQGQFVVLAGLRNMTGVLDFVDTNNFQVMASTEHYMATDVEWDPTGRYVATAVSWWCHKVDNAYWLWTFQGKLLKKAQHDKFGQLLWRPRPPPLVTNKEEIKKTMGKYKSQFEVQDKMRLSKASREIIEKRQKAIKLFQEFRKQVTEKFHEEKADRIRLRGGQDTDTLTSNTNDFEEEVVEFLVKKEETLAE